MNDYFTNVLSKEIWETKYKFHTDKTVEDTWRRVAKDLASVEKDKEYWEEEFYELMKDFKFTPGGRITANAGTNLKGTTLVNCFVSGFEGEDQDSIEGIYGALLRQAQILKSEGGYGFCCDVMRPRGAHIKGIANQSPGPVKFLELWDKSSEIITAGSGKERRNKEKNSIRKGAMMVTCSCWHPSIEDFINAKKTPGILTKFNMSVLCTDKFMQAVENNSPWDLVFPNYEKYSKEYKKYWDGNIEKWTNEVQAIDALLVYHSYDSARELWDLIMLNTYNRGEPGCLQIDTINRMNNLNYIEHISATNPSLRSNTRVLTKDGIFEIKKLAGKEFFVQNANQDWVGARCFVSKNGEKQQLYKLTVNGHRIFCTGEHKWPLANDFMNKDADYIYKQTSELNSSDLLIDYTDDWECYFIDEIKLTNLNEIVYDITVFDNTNTFVLGNGILTGNCSEQILPYNSSCLLGSINLIHFIDTKKCDWKYNELRELIIKSVRFMDNVNDVTNFPIPDQKIQAQNKRRVGLGIVGYASALFMAKLRYGSKKALKLTDKLMSFIVNNAYLASIELAKEKGSFPLLDKNKYLESKFVQQLSQEVKDGIKKYGIRNSHLGSIQPTGNSSVFSNNISSGLEPIFAHGFYRTIIIHDCPQNLSLPINIDWSNKKYACQDTEWEWTKEGDEDILITNLNDIVYKYDRNRGLTREYFIEDYAVRWLKERNQWDENAEWAVTTNELSVNDHINTMKIFAKWIDSSISKTVNIKHDYPFEDFKDVYMKAWKAGIKGFTTYRAGTMTNVLSTTSTYDNKISHNRAPKRPKELQCDVHHHTVKGKPYFVLVGLYEGEPYEVFSGINGVLDKKVSTGKIIKMRSNKYKAILDNGDDPEELCPVNAMCSDEEDALTRITSTALRHGASVEFICKQLNKVNGDLNSFAKVMSRALKKYVPDGTKTKEKCPECGSTELIYMEGCLRCSSCLYSKCN